jgi:colanic acid/amylovoran biosynthesis glycosyltransferase
MRIAFIVWQFPSLSETFILNQITGLSDRGHEVDIYASQRGDTSKMHPDVENYRLLNRTYFAQIPKNLLWRLLKGLGLLSSNFSKNPSVLLRSLNLFKYGKDAASLWLLYLAIQLLDKEPYDIIHCQFGTDGLRGMWLRDVGAINGKLITTFRGYDISWYIQKHGEHFYDKLFETGDFFLSNCDFFRQRVVKLGCKEKKIVVHGSGIDCRRFVFTPRYPPSDGIIRIATTGRLVEKKGIEYSIRAVAKLAKFYPNIEYNIIGNGPLQEELQQLIDELGVSDIVKLLGQKQQQELIEILNNSHIFTAPCVTAKAGDQDAPVNVLKEAMAMGLPVVSTYHGGIPELVEDGISGFLVPERDVDALAEKFGYLIEHPERWSEMGRAGRAYVEKHYDIQKLNDRLVEIYRQVLSVGTYQPLEQGQLLSSRYI